MEKEQIGPYQVLGSLGRGGMAVIYKALQPSVNRIVALKVLGPHFEHDENLVKRFQQEATIAANLAHQNIVKVWDASISEPPYFMALEFLEGGTLEERLKPGPLPLDEALRIMDAVCGALDAAHAKGVVHRDIKPANIMFDNDGRPVVTDFGIARATEHTKLTTDGSTLGTPDYMSPEQARGAKLDSRSDLYSAAAVFYEMLTGRTPFVTDDPRVTMHHIITAPPPPLVTFGAMAPAAVEQALMRQLSKDPNERYQTGQEFMQALRGASAPQPAAPAKAVKQPKPKPEPKAPPAPRPAPVAGEAKPRSQAMLAILLAVVLIALAGATWALFFRGKSSGSGTAQPPVVQQSAPEAPKPAPAVSAPKPTPVVAVPAVKPAAPPSPTKPAAPKPAPAAPKLVSVPAGLGGAKVADAKSALFKAGLTPKVSWRADSRVGKGKVIRVSPGAGKEAPAGSNVTLTASSGSPPPKVVKHAKVVKQPTKRVSGLTCPKCRAKFTSATDLARHKKYCAGYYCAKHKAYFNTAAAYKSHLGMAHGGR